MSSKGKYVKMLANQSEVMNMEKTKRYVIEGLTLDIPIVTDERTGKSVEVYPDFIEAPLWTPKGHRVLFSGTDACAMCEEATPGGCPDCGSCRYFKRAGERTWFGTCQNEHSPRNKGESRREEVGR